MVNNYIIGIKQALQLNDLPLKNTPQNDTHPYQLLSLYRIEMVQHRSTEFCDLETSWLVDKDFDNISNEITRQLQHHLKLDPKPFIPCSSFHLPQI